MKIKEFISKKKRFIISGGAFLVIFAIVMGVFLTIISQRFDYLQKENDLLFSSVKSLEVSLTTLKSSISDLPQNVGADQEEQLLLMGLKSDLEGGLAELSKLTDLKENVNDLISIKSTLDQLNNKLEKLNSRTTSAKAVEEGITTIIDSDVPGDPSTAVASISSSGDIIKAGQEIIVKVQADKVSDMYGYQFNLNFDKSKVSYKSGLKSSINGISTIFKKDYPDYLLIGATMIGDKQGYTGNNIDVCTLVFNANEDVNPSTFSISKVSTVDSTQKYDEDIGGWNCEVTVN